jgi:hypothetical protein
MAFQNQYQRLKRGARLHYVLSISDLGREIVAAWTFLDPLIQGDVYGGKNIFDLGRRNFPSVPHTTVLIYCFVERPHIAP